MKTLLALLLLTLFLFYPLSHFLSKAIEQIIVLPVEISMQHRPISMQVSVEAQIRSVFGQDAEMALAISQAENTSRRCDIVSHTQDYGVFQINKVHAWRGNLTDCTENIKIAYQIYQEQGWNPWTVYKTLAYKKYLK